MPKGGDSGPGAFMVPKLPANTYKANVTNVVSRDLLAVPTGKPGMYNVVTNSGTAANVYNSYRAQATKMYGTQFTKMSPAD